MAGSGGGFRGPTDRVPAVGMETVEPGRAGSKRVRDPLTGTGSRGFCGVNTEKKAAISNHMHMNADGTSKIGGSYLHGTHGERTLPEFNTSRSSISSPGENLGNKIKMPSKICTYYSHGRCNKGNSCTFLHEIEGPVSDYRWSNKEKAAVPVADSYGKSRGSEEGSQFKDTDGLTKEKLHRSLIRVYGEAEKSRLAAGNQSSFTPGVSQGMSSSFKDTLTKKLSPPINELVPSPVVFEKNQELSMGRHSGLTAEIYLNGRGAMQRLSDRGIFQSASAKGTYLDVNYPDSKLQNLPFPSDPLQCNQKLSSFGGTTWNFPNTHNKDHLSSHVSYSSYSLPGFRNPLYTASGHSFGSSTLRPTSQLGRLSQHLSSPAIEKVGSHNNVEVGTGTSRPALLASSSPQHSIVTPESPIKDEVWVTSVPFVPSIDLPDIKTPPRKQYDPLVDYSDSPKVDNKNNLKSSSISSQHTNPCVVTPKSLNHGEKLARNMSAKGSNELARLIASDRGHSSSLDDNNRVKVDDRKPNAVGNNDKTRNFRFRLADHVKELITPDWMQGYLSKDGHKLVVKKSIDKVLSSHELHKVPTSEEEITDYITINKSKIQSLVKAYVDKYRSTSRWELEP